MEWKGKKEKDALFKLLGKEGGERGEI